jgi:hypothetical protein
MMKIQDGCLSILGTTDSSSITSGSLLVNGGAGIAKNLYVGSSFVCGQNTNKGYFFASDGSNGLATAANTGAFFNNVLTGDMILRNSGYGSIRIGTTSVSNLDIMTSGNIVINTTTDSSSTTSGALQVAGGASIAKNLYVGGNVNCSTSPSVGSHLVNKTYCDSLLNLSNLTSLNINGNLTTTNLAGNTTTQSANDTLYLGKSGTTSNFFIDRPSSNPIIIGFNTPKSAGSSSSPVFQIFNNTTNKSKLFEVSSVAASGGTDLITMSPMCFISNTADTSSITTGALIISGGLGIAKNITVGSSVVCGQSTNKGYFFGGDGTNGLATVANTGAFLSNSTVGDMILRNSGFGSVRMGTSSGVSNFDILTSGNVVINTTTDSSVQSTGALQVSGGGAINKNLYVGGVLSFKAVDSCLFNKLWDAHTSGVYSGLGRWGCFLDNGNFVFGIPNNLPTKISLSTLNVDSTRTNWFSMNNTGNINCYNTDESTSKTTGALQVTGGLGIGKNITAANFESSSASITLSQPGVTIGSQTVVFCEAVKIGKLVRRSAKIVLSGVTGTASGQPSFSLLWAAGYTQLYKTAYFEIDQVRQDYWYLSTVSGSTSAAIINGAGGFAQLTNGTYYIEFSYVV